ncbi:hypothetical protein L596_027847 [Steinernema carpocapsae]|uniref:Uncharacterized protein n=1 Tax=Steinernema carpocapsae TaxID=34508 RepID=A0A4U5LWP7_STECR|nr:hypothetical protein L596_027847 [Steinernema carpocapsae]
MLRGTALWPGKTSKDQLTRIMKTIGSPDDEEVYAMRAPVRLEGKRIKPAEPGRPGSFQSLLPHATLECIGFIKRILVYCPKNRLCGRLLLTDSFFDDILAPGKQRENGQLIATIITQDEIQGLKTPRKAKKFTKADKRNAEADRRLEEACSSHRAKSTKQKNAHNSAIACRESVMLPQPSSVQ